MISERLNEIRNTLHTKVTLIAVSKTKPASLIQEAYNAGQRHFGENKVQEMVEKAAVLPKDIHWHLIGHLQSNKVKYIAPFVHLIHSVDSLKLLAEINKQGKKNDRVIDCLLQFHIAQEETKFGLDINEAEEILQSTEFKSMQHIRICGVMGMASFTEDHLQIKNEFSALNNIFNQLKNDFFQDDELFCERSMGMSSDYVIAQKEGSTMVRIGSTIFGGRG
jgi:pyridoxal phosphate enzyme (YggS family)